MKNPGMILLLSAAVLNTRAANDTTPAETTNVVVITTDYINRLVSEARTNNPSLKAADSRVRSATLNAQGIRTWEDPMAMFGGSVLQRQRIQARRRRQSCLWCRAEAATVGTTEADPTRRRSRDLYARVGSELPPPAIAGRHHEGLTR